MLTDTQKEQTWLVTGSLMILATVALALVLRATAKVMIPFALSLFIAVVVGPIIGWLVKRCRLSRWASVGIVLVGVWALVGALFFLLIVAAQTVVAAAGQYSLSLDRIVEHVFDIADRWGWEWREEEIRAALRQEMPNLMKQTAGTVIDLVTAGFLVFIFVLFLLAGHDPTAKRSEIHDEINAQIRRYLVTKFFISALTGLFVGISLHLIGLRLAFVFGVLAFLLNFIPNIGSIIATLLPIPVAVAQYDNIGMVLAAVTLPGMVQIAIGNILEPKVLGLRLQLHPVTILLSLAFWGLLWGPPGMVFAVPITASIRITLMRFESVRPIGRLMAGELPGVPFRKPAGEPVSEKEISPEQPKSPPGQPKSPPSARQADSLSPT